MSTVADLHQFYRLHDLCLGKTQQKNNNIRIATLNQRLYNAVCILKPQMDKAAQEIAAARVTQQATMQYFQNCAATQDPSTQYRAVTQLPTFTFMQKHHRSYLYDDDDDDDDDHAEDYVYLQKH